MCVQYTPTFEICLTIQYFRDVCTPTPGICESALGKNIFWS